MLPLLCSMKIQSEYYPALKSSPYFLVKFQQLNTIYASAKMNQLFFYHPFSFRVILNQILLNIYRYVWFIVRFQFHQRFIYYVTIKYFIC